MEEIRSILGERIECVSLEELPGVPKVLEDQATLEGNARKKAQEIAGWILRSDWSTPAAPSRSFDRESLVLADDSGLEVDALGGEPGVRSARYAGETADAAANNQKLLDALRAVPPKKRTARFHCVIAIAPISRRSSASPLSRSDVLIASGTCAGRIIDAPRGTRGFGYDPIFVPAGYKQTFGELDAEVKNKISHRARALAEVKRMLQV